MNRPAYLLLFLLSTLFCARNGYSRNSFNVAPAFTKTSQTITFNPLTDKRFKDDPFELVATASSGLPISFSVVSGPAIIVAHVITLTGVGKVTIRAMQEGNDDYYDALPVDRVLNINKANQTIAFNSLPNRTMLESPFKLNATTDSGLPVEMTVAGGAATISNNYITIKAAGLITVRAYQAGNAEYNSAPYVSHSFNVSKIDQIITLGNLSDRMQGGSDFTLTAQANSGQPVNLSLLSGPVTLKGNLITLLGVGQVRVRAMQSGNAIYNSATVDSFFCIIPVRPFITAQGWILTSSTSSYNQWFKDGQPIEGANTRSITIHESGIYTVQVANNDAICRSSAISEGFEFLVTGLEENKKNGWTVSPNPAQDWLRLQWHHGTPVATIPCVLFNPNGQIVLNQLFPVEKDKEILLPIQHLPAGLYILQVTIGKETTWKKVMITR
ncbi:MAG: T9SS type A sorting domain-containing protein [Bacteroidota bacterium]